MEVGEGRQRYAKVFESMSSYVKLCEDA